VTPQKFGGTPVEADQTTISRRRNADECASSRSKKLSFIAVYHHKSVGMMIFVHKNCREGK
jgi:hypothetical protein